MNRVVAIAGGFDPLHEGHLDHIKKAAALGDVLLVFVQSDEALVRKKGYRALPQETRLELVSLLLKGLGVKGAAIASLDQDGTVADTLRYYRPAVFAKGGDRTPDNMPASELEACAEIGCEIRYGIGDLLNSSSDIGRKLRLGGENATLY